MRTVTARAPRVLIIAPPRPHLHVLHCHFRLQTTLSPRCPGKARRLIDCSPSCKDPYSPWSLNPAARSSTTTDRLSPKDVQVPKPGLVASDIMAQKYFRKAGIPKHRRKRSEEASQVGCRLQYPIKPSRLSCQQMRKWFQKMMLVGSLIVSGCWTYWGHKYGYFNDESSSRLYDELRPCRQSNGGT